MSYIIKFGGSLLFQKDVNEVKVDKIDELSSIVLSSGKVTGLVCGGGKIARTYIQAGRKLGFHEELLDTLGIMTSRIHAQILIYHIGDTAYPHPISNVEEAKHARSQGKFFIAGGFVPKQSTTTVAMQICEALNQDLIILTDVDGIYDKDPKKFDDAKKFGRISYSDLEKLLLSRSDQEQIAGKYQIFDLLSFQILQRSKIKIRIINGSNLDSLKKLLTEDFQTSNIGTIITP